MATQTASHEPATLPPVQRRLLWTLGLGAFGLAFSITTTAAYLPPLLQRFTESGTLIGDVKASSVVVSAGSKMRGKMEFGWKEGEGEAGPPENGSQPSSH